jgi:hypothetical protein
MPKKFDFYKKVSRIPPMLSNTIKFGFFLITLYMSIQFILLESLYLTDIVYAKILFSDMIQNTIISGILLLSGVTFIHRFF